MKLNAIDQLALGSFYHHLVLTEIGSRQQFEIIRDPVELQPVILPNAQDAALLRVILPDARLRIIDAAKDRIFGIDDSHETILIFDHAIVAALLLFTAVKRDHARAKTQANQLMAAADSQNRHAR